MKYREAYEYLKQVKGCANKTGSEECLCTELCTNCEFDYDTDKWEDAISTAIESLEKQSEIVHCKDCKDWSYPLQIECLDGRSGTVGQCVLTGWLCGKQGYCMYGSEVE